MTVMDIGPPEIAREVKFCALDLKSITLDGVFEGYASLFNKEDLGRDIVVPGAFRDTLSKRGVSGVRMLFQHDPNQPIGSWLRLHEDARGLFVRGRIMTEVERGREILALVRGGVIDGLSIGFRAVKGVRDSRTGIRRLEQVDLWEISIVTFPMQPGARVGSGHAGQSHQQKRSLAELENWLRQDAGFTRSEARSLIRDKPRRWSGKRDGASLAPWETRLVQRMEEAARLLRSEI